MNKNKHEENLLIKEIRDLITPKLFYIQLYQDKGALIRASWVSDWTVDLEVEFEHINKWTLKKCITSERLQYELRELELRIKDTCKSCDIVAKNRKINKHGFFEGLLEEAKK